VTETRLDFHEFLEDITEPMWLNERDMFEFMV